jgi:CheY-like chemotaxis protein
MKRVLLFHKEPGEVDQWTRALNKVGYRVELLSVSPATLSSMKENPPTAVVIDLTRAPSGGRDVGIYLRHYKSTRGVPIVFVGGEPDKVAKIKDHIPDAVYTEWHAVERALEHAIAHPPVAPVAPDSLLAGYSGTPLVKKLGIKSNTVLTLVDAPDDFCGLLKHMPTGVTVRERFSRNNGLIIWFVKSKKSLRERVRDISERVGDAGIWIVWPKQRSHISSDLSQKSVRDAGLSAGLVDYKVCAIDNTWAGLKFSVRKAKKLSKR